MPGERQRVRGSHITACKSAPTELHATGPLIGHTKADHRMDRCWLKDAEGDALHAVLRAAGFNIRWLLRAIARQGIVGLCLILSAVAHSAPAISELTLIRSALSAANSGSEQDPWHAHLADRVMKRISQGRRHIVVDTLGLLLAVTVTTACVQDRDGAADVVAQAYRKAPTIPRIYTDGACGAQCARAIERSSRFMASGSRSYAGQATARPALCTIRSSRSDRSRSKASSYCPSAGSSSESMPGASAGAAWSCNMIARPRFPLPGSGSPRYVSCPAGSLSVVDFFYTLLSHPVQKGSAHRTHAGK